MWTTTKNLGMITTIESMMGATNSANALKTSHQRNLSQLKGARPRDALARTASAKAALIRTVPAIAEKTKTAGAESAQLDAVDLKNDL